MSNRGFTTARIAREGAQLAIEEGIRRLFAAVDAIDAHSAGKPFPNRGVCRCPNCAGRIAYVNLTAVKGAGRCSGACGVDFAPLYVVEV